MYLAQSRVSCCLKKSALLTARRTQAKITRENAPLMCNVCIKIPQHSKYTHISDNVKAAAGAALAAVGE